MTRYTLAGLLVAVVLTMFSAVASASHYGIGDSGIVDDAMATVLASAGVNTTADMLHKTATQKDVKALARKVGVSTVVVAGWRDFCDLLRLDGVGPKVARVMTLAGVRNLKELVKFSPADMATKIKDANKASSILGKLPEADNLQAWIDQAGLLLKQDLKQGRKPAAKAGSRK